MANVSVSVDVTTVRLKQSNREQFFLSLVLRFLKHSVHFHVWTADDVRAFINARVGKVGKDIGVNNDEPTLPRNDVCAYACVCVCVCFWLEILNDKNRKGKQ